MRCSSHRQRHSSTFPQAPRHERNKRIKTFWFELDRAFLFGTHVSSHKQFSDLESIVKTLFGLLAIEKALNKITVLAFVTVFRGFIPQHGHQALFGILLLDHVFAGLALNLATEKKLEAAIKRVHGKRVLR